MTTQAPPDRTRPAALPGGPAATRSRREAAAAGALAAVAAASTGELLSRLLPGGESPLVAVGDGVVRLAPPFVEDYAIGTLGTADKPALLVGTVVLLVLIGTRVGRAGRTRRRVAQAAVAALGALLLTAVLASGAAPLTGVVTALAATATGLLALRLLLGSTHRQEPRGPQGRGARSTAAPTTPDRRAFLRLAVLVGVGSAAALAASRALSSTALKAVEAARARVGLPPVATPLAAVPASATLGTAGVAPFLTPLADFYRIDTALEIPRVDVATWRLRIGGLVDRPLELSYDDLLDLPQVEADITISCVSNEVGGPLVGTQRWQGVRLADLLERAGVRPGGAQVVGRSVDGFTAGFPIEVALDGRDCLVAVGMGGEPLPLQNGFPARLVVPGLYGYVSATKWLAAIDVETADFDGFWVPRGWSKLGPIRLTSRWDSPSDGDVLRAGPVDVGGYAWAPHTGVSRVEVRVDGGAWQETRLGAAVGLDTWRQWAHTWDATPGRHEMQVRAVDATGREQEERPRDVRPDGATGLHTIGVDVSA